MSEVHPQLCADETLDALRVGGLKIIQGKKGYRFSLDPILLCAFARIESGDRVIDLGSGSGVIPLILARRTAAAEIFGAEIQRGLVDRARRNVELNGLRGRIDILEADVRRIRDHFTAGRFSVVISNPPFRRIGSGRHAPVGERAMARHEFNGQLEDFLQAAAYLLQPGGRFYVIYLAERLAELLALLQRASLEPKRLRCVHGRSDEAARMVLVEGRRDGRPGMAVEKPLLVFCGTDYTEEVRGFYDAEDFEAPS